MIYNENSEGLALKNLSTKDFLSFGMHDVAYIRQIDVDGRTGFAIHAADGTPLSVMDTIDEAMSVIRHNDLETAIIH